MEASSVALCGRQMDYFDPKVNLTQSITVLTKLWFTIEDDAFEKMTGEANRIELDQHGVDSNPEDCKRYTIPSYQRIE